MRQAIFTVNGELRSERRSGKNTTGLVEVDETPVDQTGATSANYYELVVEC